MKTKEALILAAGHFNGEGTFGIYKNNGYPRARLCMSQRDPWLVEQFRDAVECGAVYGPYSRGQYCYELGGQKAIDVMLKLWPWLSPPKRAQYDKAMARLEEQWPQL